MVSSQIHFSSNPNQKSLTHDWLLKFSSRLCWHLGRDEWWRSRRRGHQNCLWKLQKIYNKRDVSSILENLRRSAANAFIMDCWIHWKWSFHSTWGPQDLSQPAGTPQFRRPCCKQLYPAIGLVCHHSLTHRIWMGLESQDIASSIRLLHSLKRIWRPPLTK